MKNPLQAQVDELMAAFEPTPMLALDENLAFAVTRCAVEGLWAEFGVASGNSVNFLAERIAPRTIWGFDSFFGLPERWEGHESPAGFTREEGAFSMQGQAPAVRGNVQLVQGLFQDTVPDWKSGNPGPVAFIHVDSDLYSSAMFVLTELNDRIVPGTVLVFDELLDWRPESRGQPVRAISEARALIDWCAGYNRTFVPLSHSIRSGTIVITA